MATKKKKPFKIPRMDEEELRKFVLGVLDNTIYLSSYVPDNMLANVFMPLGLGGLSHVPEKELENIGIFYAYMNERWSTLCVNGHPIFGTARMLHKEDWHRAYDAIQKEMERRKTIEV